MCEQLRSVSKSRISQKLTSLSKVQLEQLEFGIKEMLGL